MLFKLEICGVQGKILHLPMRELYQRVALNGQTPL